MSYMADFLDEPLFEQPSASGLFGQVATLTAETGTVLDHDMDQYAGEVGGVGMEDFNFSFQMPDTSQFFAEAHDEAQLSAEAQGRAETPLRVEANFADEIQAYIESQGSIEPHLLTTVQVSGELELPVEAQGSIEPQLPVEAQVSGEVQRPAEAQVPAEPQLSPEPATSAPSNANMVAPGPLENPIIIVDEAPQDLQNGPSLLQDIAPNPTDNSGYLCPDTNVQGFATTAPVNSTGTGHVEQQQGQRTPSSLSPPRQFNSGGISPRTGVYEVGNNLYFTARPGTLVRDVNGLPAMGNFTIPTQSFTVASFNNQQNGMATTMEQYPFVSQLNGTPTTMDHQAFFSQLNDMPATMDHQAFVSQPNPMPATMDHQAFVSQPNPMPATMAHEPFLGQSIQNLPPCSMNGQTVSWPCRHETFNVRFEHRVLPPSPVQGQVKSGFMYVEKLEPAFKDQDHSIVLVHGDFHTGQVWMTKPNGLEGWATFFVDKGFTVYVVDLPACGRSNRLDQITCQSQGRAAPVMSDTIIETEFTAMSRSGPLRWPAAGKHTQWPGTGKRGDETFNRYADSTVPLQFRRHQRQSLGKEALKALLGRIGPAILLGEGSGATVSWLAADAMPESVKAVMAIEPAGPPGGTNHKVVNNVCKYVDTVTPNPGKRPYGLADIPLTFDPPVAEPVFNEHGVIQPPLNLVSTGYRPPTTVYMLQRESPGRPQADMNGTVFPSDAPPVTPRQLINLKKMPQVVVTADASNHSLYDEATVAFMKQAGINVSWVKLNESEIFGNGHLMFLELNSDHVAQALFLWLAMHVEGVRPHPLCSTRGFPMKTLMVNS